ncbi:unnamed protein product, partial [Hapterophycus canaliculatus]
MVLSIAGKGERTHAAEISSVFAERQRRKSTTRTRKRALAWGKAMLVGILAVTLVSIFWSGGGQEKKYPFLRNFLRTSNSAAADAVRGDVHAACTDPKRWLNSAGHDLLSGLPGFDHHNASMLWGTYRPGVYFGFKTRTSPVSVTGGLMWHGGDGHSGVNSLRHECNEGDGVGPYGWIEHDGRSFGKQDITDDKAGVRLVTSVVKPAQLEALGADEGAADVLLASRVEVLPRGATSQTSAVLPGPSTLSTIYFYIGLDCSVAAGIKDEDSCSEVLEAGKENASRLVVVDSDSKPRRALLVRGNHLKHGGFELESTVVSTQDGDGSASSPREEAGTATMSFLGRKGAPMVDIKGEVEKLHEAHRRVHRAHRRGDKRERAERVPFALPNESDVGSNVVVVQVTGQAPFTVDFVVRSSAVEQDHSMEGKEPPISTTSGDDAMTRLFVPSEMVSDWLAAGSHAFSKRFRETFSLEGKGFEERDVVAAKAALSNMLGGMGYFTGSSEVRGARSSGGNQLSFETSLFTAVPSRSFFPRGFLWDEGFHQLLVSAWDKSTSVDVLGHWLSVMHVHDTAGEVAGVGCSGGWLPREQILGEEARRRVPAPFMAQDISVANPPTLLLLVESLLHGLSDPESGESSTAQVDVCAADVGKDVPVSSAGCSTTPMKDEQVQEQEQEQELRVFLRKAYPLLDSWIRWLLITQRPGATGWGGQAKEAPLGAFQWRGRDPDDDRLNALTLASGLDDYPRASHPSHNDEAHVDVVSWLALACRVMQSLSSALGVEGSVPYGNLYDELLGGVFDFHWEEEEEAFFDRGLHVSDGELVDEVIMRCKNVDGSTEDIGVPLADVQARKAVCSPDQQH